MDKQREAFEAWVESEFDKSGPQKHTADMMFKAWQAAQQAQWLPIETAPRDGNPILAYAKSVFGVVDISAMFFADGDWYWFLNGDYSAVQPSHWMPLPPEPKK